METFSTLLVICAGNSPVIGEFPAQWPVTRSFDVFFDLRLNKQLSKQSWGWLFEMLSGPLWRRCNGLTEFKKSSSDQFLCHQWVGGYSHSNSSPCHISSIAVLDATSSYIGLCWSRAWLHLEKNSRVSCQKGTICHAWQVGPFWQDTLKFLHP